MEAFPLPGGVLWCLDGVLGPGLSGIRGVGVLVLDCDPGAGGPGDGLHGNSRLPEAGTPGTL